MVGCVGDYPCAIGRGDQVLKSAGRPGGADRFSASIERRDLRQPAAAGAPDDGTVARHREIRNAARPPA